MGAYQSHSALRRIEGRLWTGPAAHLLGGGLDLLEALAHAGWRRLEGELRARLQRDGAPASRHGAP